MVNVVKSENYEGVVLGIEIDGSDAQSLYDFLERLNYNVVISKDSQIHEIFDGTLIFDDELAVLRKLFQ